MLLFCYFDLWADCIGVDKDYSGDKINKISEGVFQFVCADRVCFFLDEIHIFYEEYWDNSFQFRTYDCTGGVQNDHSFGHEGSYNGIQMKL